MQHAIQRKFGVAFFLIGLAFVLQTYGGMDAPDLGEHNAPSSLSDFKARSENSAARGQVLQVNNHTLAQENGEAIVRAGKLAADLLEGEVPI